MEALFTIVGSGIVLVVFSALSVLCGADSRDDFTDRSLHPTLR